MEYAGGGDLFDKIEADVGVNEHIAHLYFTQLVSGVSYMHSKGVGHRDLKPENILLSETGSLKIADFGLATLFEYQGQKKLSTTMCGSPPYIAPEVITCSRSTQSRGGPKASGYAADLVDVWSCGVVLFVLLVGNTPWDEPTSQSWEFEEYMRTQGRSSDELWQKLPADVLSLLRAMMNVDVKKRWNFDQIKRHPWFTRKNPLLTTDGKLSDPLGLATQMLEGLRIDFSQQPVASQQRIRQSQDAMEIDEEPTRFAFTQPETPINDVAFDWERPPRVHHAGFSASQPTTSRSGTTTPSSGMDPFSLLEEEPSMSQFSATPQVPLSLTQHAQRFHDIVPSYSLTRFFSNLSAAHLMELLSQAMQQLNIPIPPSVENTRRDYVGWIRIKATDGRRCAMNGDVIIEPYISGQLDLLEVRFVKVKGDPLEWRRFFKNVVVLCKDGVYMGGQ